MTINKKLEIDCKKIISDIYFSCENDTEFFLNLAVLSANIDLIQKTCFRNVAKKAIWTRITTSIVELFLHRSSCRSGRLLSRQKNLGLCVSSADVSNYEE